ncbi:CMRF35-like molecule 3 [Lates calcarifer]|uniref:CMRF35-like molecule 3 n=1 Tax=Lates calcarifer TaxID=8187 RepID=A0AAJ7LE78_LATCA|nr:CMRF35-like molecule 3 [Lates calcarifer]
MKMWSSQNLLFILSLALSRVTRAAEVIHAAGYKGREVTVSCPYEEGYTSHEKYLCRNDCAKNYDVMIKTSEGEKGRYSIHDDNKKQVFTVTISDLYPTDAGKYWCGVTRFGMDPYTAEVKLEVEPDSCCDRSTNIQSYEGGSVSISCVYNSQYRNNLKYICRGKQPSTMSAAGTNHL